MQNLKLSIINKFLFVIHFKNIIFLSFLMTTNFRFIHNKKSFFVCSNGKFFHEDCVKFWLCANNNPKEVDCPEPLP